jgi:hypothetical protein
MDLSYQICISIVKHAPQLQYLYLTVNTGILSMKNVS